MNGLVLIRAVDRDVRVEWVVAWRCCKHEDRSARMVFVFTRKTLSCPQISHAAFTVHRTAGSHSDTSLTFEHESDVN